MTPKQEERANQLIARQIAMSGQTLDALRSAGLKEEDAVQIDFFFEARNKESATALVAYLEANDCLDVALVQSGGFLSKKFAVTGKTLATNITPAVLGQWIPWMVVQGVIHGCVFDGWGAEV
jgi:hypothetical protein